MGMVKGRERKDKVAVLLSKEIYYRLHTWNEVFLTSAIMTVPSLTVCDPFTLSDSMPTYSEQPLLLSH